MEHKEMAQAQADTEPVESYSIISYPAHLLPTSYENLIYARWMRTLRYGNDYFKLIHPDSYYAAYQVYIRSLLARPTAVVKLAVLTSTPDDVLGWSLSEGNTLHYVHVQKDARRIGLGTSLIPKDLDTITHITKTGMLIWSSKWPKVKFNPFK
jgi:hypothetical protein